MSELGASVNLPITSSERIEALDTLRGFALLGILLLNILGFGLPQILYFVPIDVVTSQLDFVVWASVELFAEGAMRALFSMLFGVGVVLFTTGSAAKSGSLHYRRTFWLFGFGVFNAFVLLWPGDILMVYALAGALLYLVREVSGKRLLIAATVFLLVISCFYLVLNVGLSTGRVAANEIAKMELSSAGQIAENEGVAIDGRGESERSSSTEPSSKISPETREMAASWQDFSSQFDPSSASRELEIAQRTTSYMDAAEWAWPRSMETLLVNLPLFLFWDALFMMLLGMALFKLGVFQAEMTNRSYVLMMVLGFSLGLAVNAYEIHRAWSNQFDIMSTFSYFQFSYQFGRLGMAFGYIGLIMLVIKHNMLSRLCRRFAAVGRMALTNYLAHSLIALILFSGAGFSLLGELSRAQLYWVVAGIWLLQLYWSPWWLARFQFGPIEWLWRFLTYGSKPQWRLRNGG